uniref:dedicator of cytokinesis protein 3-like n=1 Tax=Myxine glutinosa TaxID=7769 RepID=UPI00358F211C
MAISARQMKLPPSPTRGSQKYSQKSYAAQGCGVAPLAEAICSFHATVPFALFLEIGDNVQILERSAGWYRGFRIGHACAKGIFPVNYIHIKKALINNRGISETVTPIDDPMAIEITTTLKEWGVLWKELFVNQRLDLFLKLRHAMVELLDLRRQLMAQHLSQEQVLEIKRLAAMRLNWGNQQLGLDLVPRKDYDMVDPEMISVAELYRLALLARWFQKHWARNFRYPTSTPGQSRKKVYSQVKVQTQVSVHTSKLLLPDLLLWLVCSKEVIQKQHHKHTKCVTTLPFHGLMFVNNMYEMKYSSMHFLYQTTVCTTRWLIFILTPFLYQMNGRVEAEPQPQPPMPYHINMSLKSFGYNIFGEEVELSFFLYDVKEGKPISEHFLLRLNKQGLPKNRERLEKQSALFTDLSYKDLRRDLYIIIHVIRYGRMLPNDSRKPSTTSLYRRPYGCAVLGIREWIQSHIESPDEREFVLKVYTCNHENEWHQIQDHIIRKSSNKYNAASSHYGVILSLQLLHGEMEHVQQDPLLQTRALVIVRKLGLSDVIMPEKKIVGCDIRNDLYVILEKGEFERGGKSVPKNIEVTMYVLSPEGEVLKDYITLGSGESNLHEYRSYVMYHSNNPRWGELIKLTIPIDKFRNSHLRFEFRHCSTKEKGDKKLFGFSFTPLMREDGKTLSDDIHELCVYKCEDPGCLTGPPSYLALPSSRNGTLSPAISCSPASSVFTRNSKESLWISVLLCSTKLTQNEDLLALLKWKSHSETIQDILGKLRQVKGEEIVKFLQDILDALFAILDDNTEKYGPLVFQSLVFVINLLRATKFLHFKPVIDTYINKHFAGALAYRELMRCLKWYLECAADGVVHGNILEVLQAFEYLVKFIIQSRCLYCRATGGFDEEGFLTDIRELFGSIKLIILQEQRDRDTMVYQIISLLAALPAVLEELLQMFAACDVASLAQGVLEGLKEVLQSSNAVGRASLQCACSLVEGALFSNTDSRTVLLMPVLNLLRAHLEMQKERLLCANILSNVLITTKRSLETHAAGEMELVVETLMAVLLKTVAAVICKGQRPDLAGEFVSCLLAMLRQMSSTHFQKLLKGIPSRDGLKTLLVQMFSVFSNLMKPEIFPKDWMDMRMVTNSVIVKALQHLSTALHQNFMNDDFDFQVWSLYFSLAVLFISQPSLQLECFSASKRNRISSRYSDLRVTMGQDIRHMWQQLGDNKSHFVPGFLGPFLEVTLVPQAELRALLIPIFHDIMDCEQRRNGAFKQVEAELIDKLDGLLSEGRGDADYRELLSLITPLFGPYPSLLERIEQETWRESGASFIHSVTRLMERLLNYRDCMKGDDGEEKKIGCAVTLLNFYKTEINKEEMYVRYIHKLCDMHLQAQNFTEAGLTLQLYAELIGWGERPLGAFLHYPAQSEWQRKELLFRKILHYLHHGKSWEYGIPLCRELAIQYEAIYDYQRLSSVRKTEAAYYDSIVDHERLEPEFFRMGFYGKKFPFFLRNKEFVCRGHESERLESFSQRIMAEFPQGILLQQAGQPDDTITSSDGQHIQIFAVTPVPDNPELLRSVRVPMRVKSFYKVNNVRRFRHDRPFYKGSRDKENEFKNLWVERTTLILKYSLPGISRWFEVEKREVVEVSPLENAIEAVDNKNMELRSLIAQHQEQRAYNINPLSMCLNGVIDAAVNGGIARYQEAFFDKEYHSQHPNDSGKIMKLKELMLEQLDVLALGLSLHERIVHPEMRPLHRKLLEQFHMLRVALLGQESAALGRISPAFPSTFAASMSFNTSITNLYNRQSPSSQPGSSRVSSSSLSSQASGETQLMLRIADHLQPGSEPSSLSSTHSSVSTHIVCSAPCSTRGSPLLPEKYLHYHDLPGMPFLLRERPCSAVYPAIYEHGQQPPVFHRALIQQVMGSSRLSSDPNLSLAERIVPAAPSSWSLDSGTKDFAVFMRSHSAALVSSSFPKSAHPGTFLMNFEAYHQKLGNIHPTLPARAIQKLYLAPGISLGPVGRHRLAIPESPSSGISSLGDSTSSQPSDTLTGKEIESNRIEEDRPTSLRPRGSVQANNIARPTNPPSRSSSAPGDICNQLSLNRASHWGEKDGDGPWPNTLPKAKTLSPQTAQYTESHL